MTNVLNIEISTYYEKKKKIRMKNKAELIILRVV